MALVDTQAGIPAAAHSDYLSEQLIAELLEEDLRLLQSAQEAERLALSDLSDPNAMDQDTCHPNKELVEADSLSNDERAALEAIMADLRLATDAEYAQRLQAAQTIAMSDAQIAMKLSATENNVALDYEFAKKLAESDTYFDTDDADK
jgi:hypothetical protein